MLALKHRNREASFANQDPRVRMGTPKHAQKGAKTGHHEKKMPLRSYRHRLMFGRFVYWRLS
jgi:hypothetical protein